MFWRADGLGGGGKWSLDFGLNRSKTFPLPPSNYILKVIYSERATKFEEKTKRNMYIVSLLRALWTLSRWFKETLWSIACQRGTIHHNEFKYFWRNFLISLLLRFDEIFHQSSFNLKKFFFSSWHGHSLLHIPI